MAKTIVSMFDNRDQAAQAVTNLERSGFNKDDISVVHGQQQTGDNDVSAGEGAAIGAGTGAAIGAGAGLLAGMAGLFIPGIGPALGVGPLLGTIIGGAGIGAATGGLSGALVNAGVDESDARLYQEGVRRGGTLVTVRSDDHKATDAANILSAAGAIDIDSRASQYTESTTDTSTTEIAQPSTTEATMDTSRNIGSNQTQHGQGQRMTNQGKEIRPGEAIPVIEEELAVGKRKVEKGGVRVESHVVERPVEEQVTLREEQVQVERRPVNRPISDADVAFKEGVIEVTETDEQAVAAKRAVVKEEIVVTKQAHEHTETVRDTLRATDVRVEQMGGTGQTGQAEVTGGATASADVDFDSDMHRFASDRRYAEADWDKLEPEYRRHWESSHPGSTWDTVKDNARSAWERTKSRSRGMTR